MSPTICLEMPRKKHPETDFGQRLVALRRARGLTQVQLAETIGSNQRSISYYENHASYPPASVLLDLAEALDVTTDELLGRKKTKLPSRATDLDEQRLWRKFQKVGKLPERDQRAVIRLINSLAAAGRR